jgi:hypothetical protein
VLVSANTARSAVPIASTEPYSGSVDLREEHVFAGIAVLKVTKTVGDVFRSLHKLE